MKLFASPHDPAGALFYEYFHGDTGRGLGASHQTGWTGLIAKLIQQQGEHAARKGDILAHTWTHKRH